jgi:hypothetical protein
VFALAAASGLFVRSNRAAKRAQHGATLEGQTASRIWCLVPGGADIVGGRIGGGFAVLASVLALTMISTERPVHLEQVCPIPLLHPYLYLWCAAMLMLLSLAMELVRQRNRSTIERAKKLHEGGV